MTSTGAGTGGGLGSRPVLQAERGSRPSALSGHHSRPRKVPSRTAKTWITRQLRLQDSNPDLTAPKAVVLPLHHGGTRREAPDHLPLRQTVGVLRGPCAAVAVRSPTGHDGRMPDQDEVDRIVAAWGRQRDDLDFAPMQVLSRVDRLTARGLVARRTDPKDGRGILVSLTDAGRTAVDSAIADLLQAERDILTVVSGGEQDQLAGLLRRLILGLGD